MSHLLCNKVPSAKEKSISLKNVDLLRAFERHKIIAKSALLSADTTGLESIYTVYEGHEIMFHVSTMLPYSKENKQQVGDVIVSQSPLCLTAARFKNK